MKQDKQNLKRKYKSMCSNKSDTSRMETKKKKSQESSRKSNDFDVSN